MDCSGEVLNNAAPTFLGLGRVGGSGIRMIAFFIVLGSVVTIAAAYVRDLTEIVNAVLRVRSKTSPIIQPTPEEIQKYGKGLWSAEGPSPEEIARVAAKSKRFMLILAAISILSAAWLARDESLQRSRAERLAIDLERVKAELMAVAPRREVPVEDLPPPPHESLLPIEERERRHAVPVGLEQRPIDRGVPDEHFVGEFRFPPGTVGRVDVSSEPAVLTVTFPNMPTRYLLAADNTLFRWEEGEATADAKIWKLALVPDTGVRAESSWDVRVKNARSDGSENLKINGMKSRMELIFVGRRRTFDVDVLPNK